MDELTGQPAVVKLNLQDPRLRINHTFVSPGRIDLAATRMQAMHRTKRENRAIIVHKHAAPAHVLDGGPMCPAEMNMDDEHHEIYNKGEIIADFFKEGQ